MLPIAASCWAVGISWRLICFFQDYDLLLTPGTNGPAPLHGACGFGGDGSAPLESGGLAKEDRTDTHYGALADRLGLHALDLPPEPGWSTGHHVASW